MIAVVLHLSDIHIKSEKDPILARAKNIASAVYAHLPEASHLFIVVSGDIAYEGLEDQFGLAEKFLREITREVKREKNIPIEFVLCPGNHDCDFDRDTKLRKLTLDALAKSGPEAIDDSVIDACCIVQDKYFEFARKLNREYRSPEGDKLWQTLRFDVRGKSVVFDCINVSWMSKKREEMGALNFPYTRYIKTESDRPEVRLAVMHHPMHWLSQRVYQQFRQTLRTFEHVIITGHEHIGNFGENVDTESGDSAYVEGCVLQGEKDLSDSGFNILVFDLDRGMYRAIRYDWSKTLYEVNEEGSWEDYRNIPVKSQNPFALQKHFRDLLDDPGASFKRLSQQISLHDIFVFPDLIAPSHHSGFIQGSIASAEQEPLAN